MFFTENPRFKYVLFHQRSNNEKNKDFFDEETYGIDVPMQHPKIIENNYSPGDIQILVYNDLKENLRYRVQIQYRTVATNNEKRRAIFIKSNNYEFEFTHQVICSRFVVD